MKITIFISRIRSGLDKVNQLEDIVAFVDIMKQRTIIHE